MILVVASLPSCRSPREGSETPAHPTVEVETAPVIAGPFPLTMSALGVVVPRPGSYASLGAPAPTRVSRVYVAAGDSVRPGDSLVAFERASFDADAERAAAVRAAAERANVRAQRLTAAGILPRKEADQAASDLAQAEAAYVAARRAQELATLVSPIRGVVATMTAVVHAPVDATQPLVEVVDPSALELKLTVSPGEAAQIHTGVAVLRSDSGGLTGAPALGVVIAVSPTVDSLGRGVEVRARLSPSLHPPRLGQSLAVELELAVHADAISVPADALVPEGDRFRVFVVDSAAVAHARPVILGSRSRGRVEVVSGLHPGETVVTTGAYGVEDGATVVRIRP
jgi:membrane fusion protein (multidrug efflux system)